jgi:hypothetical protein
VNHAVNPSMMPSAPPTINANRTLFMPPPLYRSIKRPFGVL